MALHPLSGLGCLVLRFLHHAQLGTLTHTHIHIHARTLRHIHTHTHSRTQTLTHALALLHTHSLTNSHIHSHIHTHSRKHTHSRTQTHTLTHTHAHIHTLTHSHTLTLTHSMTRIMTPLSDWSAHRRGHYLHNTQDTRDEHPCPQRDLKPRSPQLSGHRPPLGTATLRQNRQTPEKEVEINSFVVYVPIRQVIFPPNNCQLFGSTK